ncbi:hypothetical protein FQA39_LY13621 [Lamprigera yunnana]|nr:hypothetical protein FQA39_LY13621 [Lamprigera yunnana]
MSVRRITMVNTGDLSLAITQGLCASADGVSGYGARVHTSGYATPKRRLQIQSRRNKWKIAVFTAFDTMRKPRQIGSKTLTFEMIEEKKILRFEDICGNEVYLGWKSVLEVWSLQSVLSYRLSYSSDSNLKHFYENVIRAVA